MDLLSEFSIKIYEPPLSERRESGRIRDVEDPLSVAMLVVDFETEVSMNGMVEDEGDSSGRIDAPHPGQGCRSAAAGHPGGTWMTGNTLHVDGGENVVG